MSYKHAFSFGWAVFWRQMWWSVLVSLPVFLASLFWINGNPSAFARRMQSWPLVLVSCAAWVFIIFPQSIGGAVENDYAEFRISVSRENHSEERLTYWESFQISLPAFALQVVEIVVFETTHLSNRVGPFICGAIEFIVSVLVIYPAISMIIVHFPFRGFHLAVMPDPLVQPTASA